MGAYIDPITGEITYRDDSKSLPPTSGVNKGTPSLNTTRDSQQQAQGTTSTKVKKQVIEYIEGVIGLIPNPDYKAKTVYRVQGVGSIFNGDYYFKKVRHTIGQDTYTVEADVIKLGKINYFNSTSTSSNRVEPAKIESPKSATNPSYEMYKVVKGDTLWALAKKYYGNGALYTKIYEANKDKIKNPNLIYVGQWIKIPK